MFSLKFNIPQSKQTISIHDQIVSIGSCFADNIGKKLIDHKFDCLANPFGIIYNPISICEILDGEIDESLTVKSQEVFFHWQAHGKIADLEEKKVKTSILNKCNELQKKLKSVNWLILTLGSAFAYQLNATGKIVANCHKIPQSKFTKKILEIDMIYYKLSKTLTQIKTDNPQLAVSLTVSPVRHFRDGLIENNRSKSRLLEVVHRLVEAHDWIHYFPAYEIQIDELRDYRFYALDRVHPNEEAIDYIWKKFEETFFDEETTNLVEEWSQIRGMINHRPIHPKSSEYVKFVNKIVKRLENIQEKINVSNELDLLKIRLGK